ncbi:unnamed protein product [Moneuplotes crassus]|uniref:Uncharacterized protein n=1 Tax=Euplotes crassus TaxID=5936 RepID=A0AAD1UGA3_EUPCR|nr:unnamed protein product [Moneuplotes crassus]
MSTAKGAPLDLKNKIKLPICAKAKLLVSRNRKNIPKFDTMEIVKLKDMMAKEDKHLETFDAKNDTSDLLIDGNKQLLNQKPRIERQSRKVVFHSTRTKFYSPVWFKSPNIFLKSPKPSSKPLKLFKNSQNFMRKPKHKRGSMASSNCSKKTREEAKGFQGIDSRKFFADLSNMGELNELQNIKKINFVDGSANKILERDYTKNALGDLLKISHFLKDQDALFQKNYGNRSYKHPRKSF